MIVTLEGRMGQGKTLGMTGLAILHRTTELSKAVEIKQNLPEGTLAYENFQDKLTFHEYTRALEAEEHDESSVVKIFANYHLGFIKYEYTDLSKFIDIFQRAEKGELILHNALFLLDEIYLWLDSRLSGSKINRVINSFNMQTRKRGVDLYGTTHSLSRVDKRFRAAVDIKASCRFDPATQFCRIRFKDMHTGKRTIKRLYGPIVYPFYDTEEIVKPQGKLYKITEEYVNA